MKSGVIEKWPRFFIEPRFAGFRPRTPSSFSLKSRKENEEKKAAFYLWGSKSRALISKGRGLAFNH
jgi:hypothetical protein